MALIHAPVVLGPTTWDWSRSYIFGVVNVTPDSFSDGGRYLDPQQAIAHGLQLVEAGADALDVGGESTRPRSEPVAVDEEKRRVLPVIAELARRCQVPISIDTYKAEVARAALEAGARIVNDVSGLQLDRRLAHVVADAGALLILGHLRGQPATMMEQVSFDDVVAEVTDELRASVRVAVNAGVGADRIWIDPGLGFGKQAGHSLALLREVARIRQEVGYPLMIGPSRKSFIGQVTGLAVDRRMLGTCAAAAAAIVSGADAVRVHDVGELAPALRVADAIARADGSAHCSGRSPA